MKKIFIGLFILVSISVLGQYWFNRNQAKDDYLRFLNLPSENSRVFVNGKETIYAKEILNGLKNIKGYRVNTNGRLFKKCIIIKIINKDQGMSFCIKSYRKYNQYYRILFEEKYVKGIGWEQIHGSPGTLTKKHIEKYIQAQTRNKE